MRLSTTKLESENVTLILKINSEEELKFFEPVHHGAKLTKLIFNTQSCRKLGNLPIAHSIVYIRTVST